MKSHSFSHNKFEVTTFETGMENIMLDVMNLPELCCKPLSYAYTYCFKSLFTDR